MISAISYYWLGWLMREFLAHILVNHTFTLHYAVAMNEPPRVVVVNLPLGKSVEMPAQGMEPVAPEVQASFRNIIDKIREEVLKLRFKGSYDAVAMMLDSFDKGDYRVKGLAEDAAELHSRLVTDLRYTTCFALEGEDEKLYAERQLFGDVVARRFPKAASDIEEAGKCLAFARGTACVFHLMRVLEVTLQELATDLKLPKIDKNWENLLNEVDSAVRSLPYKTDLEKEYRAKRSGAAAHLRNVKDAWRNSVTHPRDTPYTVEEARDIWLHTKAFTASLASFL